MKKQLFAAAVMAAFMSSSAAYAADDHGATPDDREKCYGVNKAGKNDCNSKDGANGCAGQSKKDFDANNWVYVPVGLCDKLAGGSKA